jgi:hypothetical protein
MVELYIHAWRGVALAGVVTETALAELVALERDLVRYREPPLDGGPGFACVTGPRPVLISAPHGVAHWRNAFWKQEEEYTAAIAHWAAAQTGAHAIYSTRALRPDPHADKDAGTYKAAVREALEAHDIRLVIDLHGMRGDRDFALALGTINGESCPVYESAIVDTFCAAGFVLSEEAPSLDRLVLNHPRYAGGVSRRTVTRFAHRVCGVQAAQLEINVWLRIVQRLAGASAYDEDPHFRSDSARTLQLLRGLVALVDMVASG